MLLINTKEQTTEAVNNLIQQITDNQNVVSLNQVFSIRFIENWINEKTDWIVIKDVDTINIALFNFLLLPEVYIKPRLKVKRPKVIITSTFLNVEDFEPLDIELLK